MMLFIGLQQRLWRACLGTDDGKPGAPGEAFVFCAPEIFRWHCPPAANTIELRIGQWASWIRHNGKGTAMGENEEAVKEDVAELRDKLDTLKQDLADLASTTKNKVLAGATEWSKEHPAAAIGIVAGVSAAIGFIVGMLVARD